MREFETKDYAQLCSWYEARGLPKPRLRYLPGTGRIMDGIAAGFLVRTDTPIAWLEFFISNPACGRKRRHSALEKIAGALIEDARRLGYSGVTASTQNHSIKELARRLKFKAVGDFETFFKEW